MKLKFVGLIPLLLTLIFFSQLPDVSGNRVRLQEITALTLRRGESTTGRRSAPVPQLQCIGGTAKGQYSPKVVQCYNRGFDGRDVQWECKADLSTDFQFGKIDVSCEGYEYPDDPYILAGSCGLRYELDYSASGAKKGTYKKASAPAYYDEDDTKMGFPAKILLGVIAAFILYTIYRSLTTPREGEGGGNGGGGWFGGGGGGPGYPPGGGGPPPYGWQPPPPYSDSNTGYNNKGPTTSTAGTSAPSQGPGFFTGMGLGALGGYLFGNAGNTRRRFGGGYFGGGGYNDHHASSYYDQPSTSSNYYRSSGPSTSSSSDTHTSSGFGGTSRR